MLELLRANASHVFRQSTANLRRQPDYMIIGAQKAGTTSLFNMLSQHPDIKNPKNKEMHFFDNLRIFSIREYRSQFPFSFTKLTGEATPIYMYYPGVPQRVSALFPECKFIVALRNPTDRAYSHYQMRARRGKEPLSFEAAIEAEDLRLEDARQNYVRSPDAHNAGLLSFSYRDRGVYSRQLEEWLAVFDRKQFHILCYENFVDDPQREYDRICEFLEIPIFRYVTQEKSNAYSYPPMSTEMRKKLNVYYQRFNDELFDLLGEVFPWGNDASTNSQNEA